MRTALGTLAAVLLSGVLAACSGGSGGPGGGDSDGPRSADDVAVALAAGLASGDLADVPVTTPASAQQEPTALLATRLGDLAERERAVEVGEVDVVEPDEGSDVAPSATAELRWSWPVGADTWSYSTRAEMERTGDDWSVAWSPTLVEPGLADDETLGLSSVEGARGRILGAGGSVLVTERPVARVGIDKPQLAPDQVRSSARALARLVDVDAAPFVQQVRAAGPQAFVEAITFRSDDVPPAVEAGLAGIPGARSIAGTLALAPTRDFAAPILGRVGPVTAEMVQADPDTYAPGDVAGLSGLQMRYDEQLRGRPTEVVAAVSEAGERRELFRSTATPGADLVLTLDQQLQTEAEAVLADVGPASALVALRPSTGDVLAAANGPGNGGQNLATFGQYAPGSTAKIISSLALLRAGLGADSTVPCTPTLTVDGRQFGNYSDYPASGLGDITLARALADSCNTAFISQRDRVPSDALVSAANALGLGIDHEVGFPAFFGSIDPPGSETQAAADLIGQGTVLASPLTMASVIGTVQQGAYLVPRLVVDPAPEDTGSAPAAPVTAAEAETLRTLLRGVVTGGSGALLADVPGPPVIAKTGTAEFGTGADLQTHAWMVAARGDLAVAAFVEVGAGGSATAGPLLERFLRAAG